MIFLIVSKKNRKLRLCRNAYYISSLNFLALLYCILFCTIYYTTSKEVLYIALSNLKTLYDHWMPIHFVTSRKTEINQTKIHSYFFFFFNASCFMFEKLKLIQTIKQCRTKCYVCIFSYFDHNILLKCLCESLVSELIFWLFSFQRDC